MQRHLTSWSPRRVFVAALAIASTATVAWADPIQFSKPAVAIAAPPKAELDLPDRKSRDWDFSSPSQMQRPVAPPPPVMRVPPREREEGDDEADRHPLLRDPQNFPDAVGRAEARNPLAPTKSKVTAPRLSLETVGSKARDAQHALSPISDINLDLRDRDREQRRRDPAAMERSFGSDRNDSREGRKRDLYAARENVASEPNDFFNSAPKFDVSTSRPKENADAQHLERRAAFDQLLNPSAKTGRAPGSLEPVTGLEMSKPAVPAAMPMLGGMKFELDPADPANGIKIQQERLRAPVAETLNKKYSQPTKPAAAATAESRFQTSLMRQPTVHEIPARKF